MLTGDGGESMAGSNIHDISGSADYSPHSEVGMSLPTTTRQFSYPERGAFNNLVKVVPLSASEANEVLVKTHAVSLQLMSANSEVTRPVFDKVFALETAKAAYAYQVSGTCWEDCNSVIEGAQENILLCLHRSMRGSVPPFESSFTSALLGFSEQLAELCRRCAITGGDDPTWWSVRAIDNRFMAIVRWAHEPSPLLAYAESGISHVVT
ncbi:hypothetical protein B0H17DRAFT_1123558 [Mycena rosella]|uniref:Uncharacterized protein n=1 Tax=Mycena rosella TaxID=1033263 RepID=A0AAD7H2Z5_MYCRO|nr:hypothetical protein B0H17DRAFT_1123558 [Mycena rosella]